MARGVTRFKSLRGFAGHRGGTRGKFLSKWKEKGSIEVWFHTKELPIAIWRHGIPQIVTIKDRDNKKIEVAHVWTKNLVCHEEEAVLDSQYFRDRDTGVRNNPPERCGICKLIEWCYQQAVLFEETRDQKKPKGLSFTTPIFRFEGDDPKETTTLHIGGITNLFGKDLTDAQKEDLREAKISLKHAWKENAWAKCNYAMLVVDNAHPETGCQIAVEAGLLGDRVKKVIEAELEDNETDIQRSPYAIKWKYLENESEFNKKYDAVPLRKLKPSKRILEIIRGEAPELPDDLTTPFNQQAVRSSLERHCLLPKGTVPWDVLFPSEDQSKAWEVEDEEAEKAAAIADAEEVSEEEGDDEPSDADEDAATSDDEDEDEEEEEFACDNEKCGKPVKASDTVCPHCGFKFEVDGEEEAAAEPEPAPKPMRSRSEALAAKSGGSGGSKGNKKKEEPAPPDDDDDIPFIVDMTRHAGGRV